jgi:hypothetical protein
MCEPITAANAVYYVMAAAASVSAASAYSQGQQQKKLGEYNAKVDENNAKTAASAAEEAAKRGQIAEDQHRDRVRQFAGSQKAAMAAAGGDLTDQSSMNILADTARAGEFDALTIRSNAAREAWGLGNQADNFTAQAAGTRFQGSNAASAGNWGAATSLLNGASGAYSKMKVGT